MDANGVAVPEADPAMCMGGMGGFPTLKPGEEWRQTLRPLNYLRLTKPGKYTIRITHDLGWKEKFFHMPHPDQKDAVPFVPEDWNAPIGETQIEFLVPNEQQAKKIWKRSRRS